MIEHPRESEWWTRFDECCAKLGVVDYQCVVGNICADGLAATVGQFDITHCARVPSRSRW